MYTTPPTYLISLHNYGKRSVCVLLPYSYTNLYAEHICGSPG